MKRLPTTGDKEARVFVHRRRFTGTEESTNLVSRKRHLRHWKQQWAGMDWDYKVSHKSPSRMLRSKWGKRWEASMSLMDTQDRERDNNRRNSWSFWDSGWLESLTFSQETSQHWWQGNPYVLPCSFRKALSPFVKQIHLFLYRALVGTATQLSYSARSRSPLQVFPYCL